MKDLGPSLRSYLISSMISNRMGARMQVGGRMVCSSSRFSLNHRFQKGQLFVFFRPVCQDKLELCERVCIKLVRNSVCLLVSHRLHLHGQQ